MNAAQAAKQIVSVIHYHVSMHIKVVDKDTRHAREYSLDSIRIKNHFRPCIASLFGIIIS